MMLLTTLSPMLSSIGITKLEKNMEDEQFQTIKKLCKMIYKADPEIAAYAVERFMGEYYIRDESLKMSLSLAKKTLKDMTVNKCVECDGPSAIRLESGDWACKECIEAGELT